MVEQANKTDIESGSRSALDTPKTKKHRIWPWIVAIIALIILIPVLITTFFGFMPGLSSIFGMNKPVDLGVKWTAADYASYQAKTGGKFVDFTTAPSNPNKPGKKIVFANPKQMDVSLTQEEITATINSVGWLWMPIKNAQVKFVDGGLEVSGSVNAAYIPNFVSFIGGVGYSQSTVDQASSYAKLLGDPPIYIKADASVSNNVLALNVTKAKVGRFNIPVNIANNVLSNGTGSIKTNATPEGYEAKNVSFQGGQMHFFGTSPTTVYVKKN